MRSRPDAPPSAAEREALAVALHAKKNALYADLVGRAGIPLRGGVLELMRECRFRGVRMAIATTTSRANVAALLGRHIGDRWAGWFDAIVCGEDVQRKKPDPEVYVRALRMLDVDAERALAIEDSPAGVAAANAAGCAVIVTRSIYFADAPVDEAIAVGPGLHTRDGWQPPLPADAAPPLRSGVGLDDIAHWLVRQRARM